ncbi:Nucleoside transporter [Dirofilaria immitis]|nr:Nucleoside transporter [Dirofilaria immitis]
MDANEVISGSLKVVRKVVGMVFDKPPKDKYNAVYFILLLHGIGVLMPWNMFITIAPSYYVNYKFVEMNADGMVHKSDYAVYFLPYLGLASQIPNLLLNLINLFVQIKGGLRRRISFSLFVLAIIVLITLIFTLINTSQMIGAFFFITMITVVLLNAANGVYQSSLYGLTANFPPQYTNALILGNNICGTFVSVVNIVTLVGVLQVLYEKTKNYDDKNEHEEGQHLERINTVNETVTDGTEINRIVPKTGFKEKLKLYLQIFKRKTIHSDYNISVIQFFAAAGSILANFVQWPSPKWMVVPVVARIALIPLLIFCYFRPEYRTWNVWFYNVWIYIIFAFIMSISSGYFSSVIMMYVPRIVEPSKSTVAGMIAAFFLIFGP